MAITKRPTNATNARIKCQQIYAENVPVESESAIQLAVQSAIQSSIQLAVLPVKPNSLDYYSELSSSWFEQFGISLGKTMAKQNETKLIKLSNVNESRL